jgi:predicted  nucleic acid-binding Zn-ribbon protein
VDRASREHPLNADPATQLHLLHVQEQDTLIAQLIHRGRTLPDAARLADVESRLSRLRDQVVAAETIAGDLELDQSKADRDVEQVRDRVQRDQHLLNSGSVGDPKQLQSIQAELQSLARRQGDLEDVELEIMERVEGARAAVVVFTGQRDELAAEREEIAAGVREQRAAIEVERQAATEARSALAANVPADLLALYDKIRAEHGGVGAAPLHRGTCQGCRMQLPPTEIEALRAAAPDAVVRCEDCRRILVRTPESGL